MRALVRAVADWWNRPARNHTHSPRPDWLAPDEDNCWCGARMDGTDRLIEDLRKNGAPADTGTPPNPTAVKEPKDMHTLQSETTPRGRQMAAALALAHLLETGPAEDAEWRIDRDGRLHGHVNDTRSDAANRRALDAFANFLHADLECGQGRSDHAEWVRLCTTGTYRGVPVNVWTRVDVRALHGNTR